MLLCHRALLQADSVIQVQRYGHIGMVGFVGESLIRWLCAGRGSSPLLPFRASANATFKADSLREYGEMGRVIMSQMRETQPGLSPHVVGPHLLAFCFRRPRL